MDIKKFDISRLSGNRTFDPALITYEDSIDIILDELQSLRKSFVKIGWYLKHINEGGKYRNEGYEDIFDLAFAKFKMSKGTVNRLINLCINFSVGHDSPELDEHYQEFDESQLFEMLPMNEAEREEISPNMTVKQIREKKTEQRAKKEPPDKLIAEFCKKKNTVKLDEFDSISELKNYFVDWHGKSHSCGGPPDYRCTPRGISLENYDEITWLNFAKRVWNLKESEESLVHEVQKVGDSNVIVAASNLEENDFEQITAYNPNPAADPNATDMEYIVSDGVEASGSDHSVISLSEVLEPDCTALMKEACSLSQRLCEGFRFSAQNHTLSQIEEFKEWTFKLNNIAHTLYELSRFV